MLSNDSLKEDNLFSFRGLQEDIACRFDDCLRSQISYYDKEKEEDLEHKNLFAYELYEHTDLMSDDNEGRDYDEKLTESSGRRFRTERLSHSSTVRNLGHKKIGARMENSETLGAYRNVKKTKPLNKNKHFNNTEILVTTPTQEKKQSKEKLLKHIMSMNFPKDKSKTAVTTETGSIRRPKSSEVSRVAYGERLYQKGLAYKERSSKNLTSIRMQKLNREMRECTFTPQLNNTTILCNLKATYSRSGSEYKPRPKVISILSSKYSNNVNSQVNSQIHSQINSPINLRVNSQLNSQLSSTKTTELFDINKVVNRSRKGIGTTPLSKITNITVSSNNYIKRTKEELKQHSEKLYNDAEKIRSNREIRSANYYSQQCPFQPNITDKNTPNIYNFFFRLQKWVDKRNEKYENDLEKINYDSKTGLRLFFPQVTSRNGLSKQFGLTENNRSKCLELYQDWKKRQARCKEIQMHVKNEEFIMSNYLHTDAKSAKLTGDLIKKIFTKIFELIVSNSSGVIDGKDIDVSSLPEKIVDMLTPLLNELKDQSETLTLDEFHLACKHLYNFLPYDEKLYLMEWYSKRRVKKDIVDNSSNFTFKPTINKNSEKISSTSNKYASNFYLKAIDSLKNKEHKLREQYENPYGTYRRPLTNANSQIKDKIQNRSMSKTCSNFNYTSVRTPQTMNRFILRTMEH